MKRWNRVGLDKAPPFQIHPPTSDLQKGLFRLATGYNTPAFRPGQGTAIVVAPGVFLTARHIILEILSRNPVVDGKVDESITAFAVVGSDYIGFDLANIALSNVTDIAIMTVGNQRYYSSSDTLKPDWQKFRIAPFAPKVGARVAGMGFSKQTTEFSTDSDGSHHIINDDLAVCVGRVEEIHDNGRDRSVMPFPVYRIGGETLGGMSGGPVIDDHSRLCGLVCNGLAQQGDHPAYSYGVSIWPAFGMSFNAPVLSSSLVTLVGLAETGWLECTRLPDVKRKLESVARRGSMDGYKLVAI